MKSPSRARSIHSLVIAGCLMTSLMAVWATFAAPPTRITAEVASIDDIAAEIRSLAVSIESAVSTEEQYSGSREVLKRQAIQVAILAQALADHDAPSDLKKSALTLRNAALETARAKTFEDAGRVYSQAKAALDGKIGDSPGAEAGWDKIAPAGALMPLMKERTESIRRALRRSKDPAVESRHAMAVALMILAVHEDTRRVKNPDDKPAWQAACLDVQREFSQTAAAIRDKDTSTAADRFRLGMEACDRCHEQFKP